MYREGGGISCMRGVPGQTVGKLAGLPLISKTDPLPGYVQ